MALVFDGFADEKTANKFADKVKKSFKLDSLVFLSQEESDEVDPFPFVLNPPIVLVKRSDDDVVESKVIKAVEAFGGEWAGT